MSEEEFLEAIIDGHTDIIAEAIKQGIDISIVSKEQKDGRRPPIEFASFSDNYDVLYLLWQENALPTTSYIEDIFEKFNSGKTPRDLSEDKKLEQNKSKNKVTSDLSKNFSTSKLKVYKFNFDNDEYGCAITITFKPFKYNDEIFENTIELVKENALKIESNTEIDFIKNDFSGSFYFENVHNPVEIKKIKFGNIKRNKIEIEVDLFFDFEFENTSFKNELLTIKSSVIIS